MKRYKMIGDYSALTPEGHAVNLKAKEVYPEDEHPERWSDVDKAPSRWGFILVSLNLRLANSNVIPTGCAVHRDFIEENGNW